VGLVGEDSGGQSYSAVHDPRKNITPRRSKIRNMLAIDIARPIQSVSQYFSISAGCSSKNIGPTNSSWQV
jgi:hypothetical protein